jgi:hypothetical protein
MTDQKKIEQVKTKEALFNILENQVIYDGGHILIDNLVAIANQIDNLYSEKETTDSWLILNLKAEVSRLKGRVKML